MRRGRLFPSAHTHQLASSNKRPLLSNDADVSMVISNPSFLPISSFRALFLGLSNNPHITDLHLDISSCEVRSVTSCSSSAPLLLMATPPPPMFSPQQLRSAGAGVIQELFPRVSCVGTLDVSDNGERTCAGQLAASRLGLHSLL